MSFTLLAVQTYHLLYHRLFFFYAAHFYKLIRLLPIVSFPSAFSQFHVGKDRLERGVFRRAGIYAKLNLTASLMHVTYAHLREVFSVLRALNAIVILSARESVPHCLHIGRNGSGSPIGISIVGNHAS